MIMGLVLHTHARMCACSHGGGVALGCMQASARGDGTEISVVLRSLLPFCFRHGLLQAGWPVSPREPLTFLFPGLGL